MVSREFLWFILQINGSNDTIGLSQIEAKRTYLITCLVNCYKKNGELNVSAPPRAVIDAFSPIWQPCIIVYIFEARGAQVTVGIALKWISSRLRLLWQCTEWFVRYQCSFVALLNQKVETSWNSDACLWNMEQQRDRGSRRIETRYYFHWLPVVRTGQSEDVFFSCFLIIGCRRDKTCLFSLRGTLWSPAGHLVYKTKHHTNTLSW